VGENKTEELTKLKKLKKIIEKKKLWKNPIKILIKPTGSVRFGFISLKLKKSNRTQTEKKRAKLGKNRAK
jgi:hypothetical protein